MNVYKINTSNLDTYGWLHDGSHPIPFHLTCLQRITHTWWWRMKAWWLLMMLMMMVVEKTSKSHSPGWRAGPIWPPKRRSWLRRRSVSRNAPCLWIPRFFRYIWGYAKRETEMTLQGPKRWVHAPTPSGRVGPPLGLLVPPLVCFQSPGFLFWWKTDVVFFLDFISCENWQKEDFAKNSVRFSSFYTSMGRFRSKSSSKVLGKVDTFWMYQLPQA